MTHARSNSARNRTATNGRHLSRDPTIQSSPHRLLIRGVNWLGDAVMTTPALQRLRQAFPGTHITLLVHEKLEPLWRSQPLIDAVVTFRSKEGLLGVAHRLRAGRYDVGLALPNSHRSALELWLGRITRRFGLRTTGRTWFLTDPVNPQPNAVRMRKRSPGEARRRFASQTPPDPVPPPSAHQIHDYLHLAAALGANPAPLPPRLVVDHDTLQRTRAAFGLDPGTVWLGLNPGAEYGPAKRWPPDRFANTALQLQRLTKCRWLVLGGAADRDLALHTEQSLKRLLQPAEPAELPVNLAGRTNLEELCAVLKCCHALLTNDTGPMHVAAALGVPVVVPFGSTSPELTGPGVPGDPRHRLLRRTVPCSPCFLRTCPLELQCLNGIRAEDAVAAIREVLANSDLPASGFELR